MKANEAPEKLYLHPTAKGKVGASWLTFPLTNEDIEYVRKDAFIEKALEFIKANVDRIVNNQHGVCIGCMDDEFKKYIEGE